MQKSPAPWSRVHGNLVCHKDGKQTKGIHECTEKSMNCMNIGIKRMVFDMNKSMNYWEWVGDEGKRLLLFGMVWCYFCLANRKFLSNFFGELICRWGEVLQRRDALWIGYIQIVNIIHQISFSSWILTDTIECFSNPAPLNRNRW